MSIAVLILHIVACVALILVVLLQTGKGASMGAAFGGSSQTVFGSAGATPFLAKLTTAVAILFMITSLGLAIWSNQGGMPSVMQKAAVPAKQEQAKPKTQTPAPQPAAPAEKTPAPAGSGAGK